MKKIMLLFFVCTFAAATFAQEKPNITSEKAQSDSPEYEKIQKISKVNQNNATNTVVSYDFTTGSDKYYGGTDAAVEVEPGIWAMIAGNANGDADITASDYNLWLPDNNSGASGYLSTDLNLDGNVTASDYNLWLPNNNAGRSSQVPN